MSTLPTRSPKVHAIFVQRSARSVIVRGVIISELGARDKYTNLRVEADRLIITDQPMKTVRGLVLVQVLPFTDYRYGDRARAEGKLQTPANYSDFDRECLARQDAYSIISCPRVNVMAREQVMAPLGWLAPFTGCAFKARAKSVIAQTLRVPESTYNYVGWAIRCTR